ncbi:MAG: protein translocase subunit SecDF [Bacteroidetes bacterium]|nr:MAG: protein translocase subunit SecDF [Bacteroidota bacterium]
MQNKGAVRIFAIALALVCLFQLSFTFFSARVEGQAEDFAAKRAEQAVDGASDALGYEKAFRKAEKFYLDSVANDVVYNFAWIRKYTYQDCKEREINLGLDLKGGMNVMLEVSVYDVLMALSNHSTDPQFLEAMQKAAKMAPSEDFVSRFQRAYQEVAPQGKLAAVFSTVELRDKVPFNATNEEVIAVLREEAEGAISNSEIVIRNRIDRFGVAQPVVQRLERSGRILVELPGVKDPERVRKLLQGTASLAFWETYENQEVYPMLMQVNAALREVQTVEGEKGSANSPNPDEVQAPDASEVGDAEKSPMVKAIDSVDKANDLMAEVASADSLAKEETEELLNEVGGEQDSTSFNKEEFARQNPLFAYLTPSVTQDGQLFPGPVVGMAHYRDTVRINAMLHDERVAGLLPRSLRLMWTIKPVSWDKSQSIFQLVAIRVNSRDGQPLLDGSAIAGARTEFGDQRGEAEVSMWMNPEGAKVWARMTADNLKRSIAIVLDDFVYSFPTVQSEIKGGRSSITGGFTIKEAKDLVNVLQSGKLPAPARIIQEEIVGPSLGQQAIDSGITSFAISLVIILLFMLLYYSFSAGLIANIALVCNLFFIVGVLASFQATLTLPGIAGIILTLGMAVDANVLIFERIREEIAKGKGLATSVDDGFKNALSAIIDGNVTTLITGIILAVFGSGPIRGFATTLVIGILTSMFTAIFITRLIMLAYMKRNWSLKFETGFSKNLLKGTKYKFIAKRKVAYIFSGVLLLAVVFSLFTRGFDEGIDFAGGRTYEVQFDRPVQTEEVAGLLEKTLGKAPQVKFFGESNQVKIITNYRIDDNDPGIDAEVDSLVYLGLKPLLKEGVSQSTFLADNKLSSAKVGPTIALDIRREAVVAIFFALIAIFLYILIRFRNWRFSAGAVLGLAHDTLMIIGVYTLLWGVMPFPMEVDQAFIAAVLTIIGYSINDTVVIYDRIREFMGLYPKRRMDEIMDDAINSTLSRTFATSFSTLIVLLPMVIFGGDSIRGFVFALTVGVLVGTYSSIFVSAPLAYEMGVRTKPEQKPGQKRR